MKAKHLIQNAASYILKALLIGALCLIYYLLKDSKFKEIDYFARDTLQYLNSNNTVDKNLVTLTLNIFTDEINYPHSFSNIKKTIDTLQKHHPKNIVIMMEPLDFHFNRQEKKEMFDYLNSQKNVFLNMNDAREYNATFFKDEIFKYYPNTITFNRCSDEPILLQNRRVTLSIDPSPEVELFKEIKKMGYNPKAKDYFKYSYRWWNADIAYIKNYPLGTYGNYQSHDLFSGKLSSSIFENKTVILGTNDQYSFLGSRSTLNILNKLRDFDQNKYQIPAQDTFANILNFHITGDYIKYVENFNDLLIIIIVLCTLVLIPLHIQTKMYAILMAMPAIVVTQVILYLVNSFYIDFSRSIMLLVLIQYFAIPFILLTMFKKQEEQKLQAITDTRIDALLSVSEKVAHDIRSPLGAINLILSRVNFSDPEHKEIVKNALKRIDDSAENILAKYKNKNDRSMELFDKINIHQTLEKIIAEKKILNTNIDYQLVSNEIDNVLALGYSIELERVLSNILDNSIYALKNIQKNPAIKIVVLADKKQITIDILDNGIGIPNGILKLLGNEQISTKNQDKGNGIGVLHAKRTIERMNGTFDIESIENEFSRVIIKLNLAT